VSTTLEKALFEKNIKSGFCTTRIFPFNPSAIDEKMGPSTFYREIPTDMNGVMSKLYTVDLNASESLYTLNDTFVSYVDFNEPQEGPMVQAAME
jgi:hypothetical protein